MGEAKRRRERTALAAQIEPSEAAYLRRVRAQTQEAARIEQQAAELEQRAGTLRRTAVALYGAHESFVDHLCEKYGLDPKTDLIDPDTAAITRMPVLDLDEDGLPADGQPVNGMVRP